MKTKLFSLFVVVLITTNVAFAADCYIDGILYDLYGNEATVTCDNNLIEYTGHKTIPSSITYQYKTYRVVAIAPRAFKDCPKLTGVTIGNSVTTIGYSAFENCPKLTSVTIPNSVTEIGSSAFEECSGLTSVTIGNSVTTIGYEAFAYCRGLTSVTIGNSVTTIGDYAFRSCSGLTSVTIPNSVTTIGSGAFYLVNNIVYSGAATGSPWGANCVNGFVEGYLVYSDTNKTTLVCCSGAATGKITIPNSVITIKALAFVGRSKMTGVTIGNSVTTIGDSAFYQCNGLTSVTIPNSVTTIGNYAFRDCDGLTSVKIGHSVTTIGTYAFENCDGLKTITCYATNPPTCGYRALAGNVLYVPAGSIEAYKQADVWKNFKTILPIQAEEVIVTETQVNPSANIVSIAWRAVENAYNYIIVIKQGEDTICKLTFNAEGQLVTSQYYAPQRARLTTSTTDAEQTATGWRYVIRDLQEGTEYTYSIIAYDETDNVIDSQSGTFRTLLPSGLEDLTIDKNVGNKFIYGNQLYIRRGDNLYTATGARVK